MGLRLKRNKISSSLFSIVHLVYILVIAPNKLTIINILITGITCSSQVYSHLIIVTKKGIFLMDNFFCA